MKLFTKIALGISGFFFCVAAICLVAAIMMGGTLADVENMVEDGKFSFGPEDGFHIQVWGDNGLDFDINLGDNQKEYTEREILHDCNKIYLEVAFGKIDIYYDDVEYVQVEQKNIPGFSLTASESEKSLHIEGDVCMINTSGAELTVIHPRDVK